MDSGLKVPFTVSQQPTLGVPMMYVDGVPGPSRRLAPPPPAAPDDQVAHLLDALRGEVVGLRVDLARRSFGGRCRRFWTWLTGGWRG